MNKWGERIDNNTLDFQDHFGTLTAEQLNWKPDAKTWSIAQNIDHLMVINQSYFSVFELLKEGTYTPPLLAKSGFIVSFLGKFILKSVQPDRRRRMKTFQIWKPSESDLSTDIIANFEKHQSELKQQFESLIPWIEKGAVISSPANKNIVYRLETSFDIMITHEQRHLEQAKEVLNKLPV